MYSACYFCPIVTNPEYSRQILVKDPLRYKISWKSGQRMQLCSMQTDSLTKPVVAFRGFANAHKNSSVLYYCHEVD